MLKLLPLLAILAWAVATWWFSSRRMLRDLAQSSTPLDHPRLHPIVQRLGAAMDLPPVKVRVHEVAPINGLALPDGQVYLTRGFLNALDQGRVTENELASVIAHELGHVTHGHVRRRMIDFAGQNVIRAALMGTVGRMIPFIGAWIAQAASHAVVAGLSRRDEFQADAFAAALMVKAGFGTGPQKSLLGKLGQLTGTGRPPAWAATHPPAEARITAIKALEHRWELT